MTHFRGWEGGNGPYKVYWEIGYTTRVTSGNLPIPECPCENRLVTPDLKLWPLS
jgi:hypothetical protein